MFPAATTRSLSLLLWLLLCGCGGLRCGWLLLFVISFLLLLFLSLLQWLFSLLLLFRESYASRLGQRGLSLVGKPST